MRRGRRMGDEALCVAEIVADLEDLKRIHKAERVFLAALDLEGDHRPASRHLTLGERGLRMIGTPRIEHANDLLASGKKVRDRRGGGAMALDAQGESFKTLQQHPGI